jgi:hypothetical protein
LLTIAAARTIGRFFAVISLNASTILRSYRVSVTSVSVIVSPPTGSAPMNFVASATAASPWVGSVNASEVEEHDPSSLVLDEAHAIHAGAGHG